MSVEEVTLACLADRYLDHRRSFGSSRAGWNNFMAIKLDNAIQLFEKGIKKHSSNLEWNF